MAVVLGCSPSAPSATPADDVIRVLIPAAPASFDPRIGTDEASRRVHELLYSPLLRIDERRGIVPALAIRFERPDPLTYVAYLRSGVRFHDGHELTARDVVYTFSSLLDDGGMDAARDDTDGSLDSVTALDERRVQFTLKEPVESFPVALALPIVPDGAGDSLQTFPIGTGPYRFHRYTPDEQIELTAFERYWDGLPQNAGVVLRIVSDEATRALALREGRADLAIDGLSPAVAQSLQEDGLTVLDAPAVDGGRHMAVVSPEIGGVRLTPGAGFLMLKDVRRKDRDYELTN